MAHEEGSSFHVWQRCMEHNWPCWWRGGCNNAALTGCFSLFQAMRTLNWKYHLGLVSLDVELADRTLSLSVSPVHAAIILHFQTKSECRG